MDQPANTPKPLNDIEALQKCSSYIDRVEPAQDRLRVVKYLQDKYLTDYQATSVGVGG